MKRVPLYRAPLAGLMSLAILVTSVPPAAIADPPPHANNAGAKEKGGQKNPSKRVSKE